MRHKMHNALNRIPEKDTDEIEEKRVARITHEPIFEVKHIPPKYDVSEENLLSLIEIFHWKGTFQYPLLKVEVSKSGLPPTNIEYNLKGRLKPPGNYPDLPEFRNILFGMLDVTMLGGLVISVTGIVFEADYDWAVFYFRNLGNYLDGKLGTVNWISKIADFRNDLSSTVGISEQPRREAREGGPTVETQVMYEIFSRLKKENPQWTQVKLAEEAMLRKEVSKFITDDTVRNVWRAMKGSRGWEKWKRADKIR